jgi:chromate reductase, NAD(P)H dehydrogenase (quinone)
MNVLGISGSLRKGSYNSALLRATIALAEKEKLPITFDVADIRSIPLYDDDVRTESGFPEPAAKFRESIKKADAILFVTPEYNYSVPGVLKNAIDWASRPPNQPFAGKPFAVMGASGGMSGTMRAQYHLRQIAVFVDMHGLNKPEIFVRNAKDIFDPATLELKDETTKKLIVDQLKALIDHAKRFTTTAAT